MTHYSPEQVEDWQTQLDACWDTCRLLQGGNLNLIRTGAATTKSTGRREVE